MKTYTTLFTILFCLFLSDAVWSNTCTAIASGNWSNGAIWSCGSQPSCGDVVIISSGITVTVDEIVSLDASSTPQCNQPTILLIDGTLLFQTGKKINLGCGSSVAISPAGMLIPGSGSGNSNWLSICASIKWNASNGSVNGPVSYGTPISLQTQLIAFNIELVEKQLQSTWTIESDEFTERYEIQTSSNGIDWETVATQAAKSLGSVTTYQALFTENKVVNDLYVTLVAVSKNGNREKLATQVVNEKGSTLLSANPIIQGEPIIFTLQANEIAQMIDLTGKIVFETSSLSAEKFLIDSSSLQPGTYYLQLSTLHSPIRLVIQ